MHQKNCAHAATMGCALRDFLKPPIWRVLWVLTLMATLAACASGVRSKSDELTAALRAYGGAVRWGGMNDAAAFLDPQSAAEHPISKYDMERFAQFTIVGYRTQSSVVLDPTTGIARQVALIELVNKHTQSPKSILDDQQWRFDSKSKRWLLISGLPNLDNLAPEQ
jgi:hypothetical protein